MDRTGRTILLPSHVGMVPVPQVMELMSSVLEVSVPEIRETVKRDRCDWLAAIFNLLLDYPDGRLSLQKMLSDEQSQSVGSSQESLNGVSGFSQGLSQGMYVGRSTPSISDYCLCPPLSTVCVCVLSTVCVHLCLLSVSTNVHCLCLCTVYCLCPPLSTVCVHQCPLSVSTTVYCLCPPLSTVCVHLCLLSVSTSVYCLCVCLLSVSTSVYCLCPFLSTVCVSVYCLSTSVYCLPTVHSSTVCLLVCLYTACPSDRMTYS